ncbi:MAG TPA: MoaD/ThiS family protein [Phycisphaerae bacterium]|nr:MoaD/ThiS family protein [Phycisphaerae bacterium]
MTASTGVRVLVLFLGPARDWAGRDRTICTVPPGSTIASLERQLSADAPALSRAARSIRFAVNQEFAERTCVLQDGDEVAVIPPVSGG